MPNLWHCPECGRENAAEIRFCPQCGTANPANRSKPAAASRPVVRLTVVNETGNYPEPCEVWYMNSY